MSGTDLVSALIEILVSGIQGIATGIGSGLSEIVTNLVFVTTGTGADAVTSLSPFAIIVATFCAISLGMSLMRLVYRLFTSFGQRNG